MKTGKKVLDVIWNASINVYEIFEYIDEKTYICRRFDTIEQLVAFKDERSDVELHFLEYWSI